MTAMPPGSEAAADRLARADGSIYAAFDELGCGFDHEWALSYIAGSPSFNALPEDERGKVVGLVLGFAITAVEAERENIGTARALRSVLAAIAFLFELEGDVYDRLNAPDDATLDRIRRVIGIRHFGVCE